MSDRGRALWVTTLLLVSCAALAGATLLLRAEPLRALFGRMGTPVLFAWLVVLAAVGVGRALHALLGRLWHDTQPRSSSLADFAADFVLGLPLFGTGCFLFSLLDASLTTLLPWSCLCALGGLAGLAITLRRSAHHAWEGASFAGALVLVALVMGALMAQRPPLTLDEVAYHLAVPKAWLIEGHVLELPLNSHSYFPFGIESSALPLLALLGDEGAVAFHFVILSAFAAALVLLYDWLRPALGPAFAGSMSALVATTPALLLTSGTAWIEAPFLGLTLVLCASLQRALEAPEPADRHFIRVALAVAAGCASKYTWALVLIVGFGPAFWVVRRDAPTLRKLVRSACAGLGLGCTFFVRNALWTDNPVAPFLQADTPHVTGFNDGSGPLTLTLNYVFDPLMADESLGVGLPWLFGFAWLGWWCLRERAFLRLLGGSAWLATLALGALAAAGRLLVPFASLAAATAYAALAQLSAGRPGARRGIEALVLSMAAFQLFFAATIVGSVAPLDTISGRMEPMIEHARPAYPAVRRADSLLPAASLSLVLGIHESYWFTHRVRAGGNFDGPRVAAYLEAQSPEALLRKLRRDGFTHVVLYPKKLIVGEASDHGRRAETRTVLSKQTAALLQAMLARYATSIGEGNGASVLALHD